MIWLSQRLTTVQATWISRFTEVFVLTNKRFFSRLTKDLQKPEFFTQTFPWERRRIRRNKIHVQILVYPLNWRLRAKIQLSILSNLDKKTFSWPHHHIRLILAFSPLIIEWSWVWCEESCRLRRVFSAEVDNRLRALPTSHHTKAEFNVLLLIQNFCFKFLTSLTTFFFLIQNICLFLGTVSGYEQIFFSCRHTSIRLLHSRF